MGSAGELKDGKLEVKFAKLGFYPVCFKSKNAKERSCPQALRPAQEVMQASKSGLASLNPPRVQSLSRRGGWCRVRVMRLTLIALVLGVRCGDKETKQTEKEPKP